MFGLSAQTWNLEFKEEHTKIKKIRIRIKIVLKIYQFFHISDK